MKLLYQPLVNKSYNTNKATFKRKIKFKYETGKRSDPIINRNITERKGKAAICKCFYINIDFLDTESTYNQQVTCTVSGFVVVTEQGID